MFKNLRESFKTPPVTLHPHAFVEASIAIDRFWTNNRPITQDFDQGYIDHYKNEWATAIVQILQQPNALEIVRNRMIPLMFDFGRLQVLVMDAPPFADQSGFRGWLGITGELKQNLEMLAETEEGLREWLYSVRPQMTLLEKWNCVLFRYRTLWAEIEILNALRKPLGDVHPEIGADWYWPLLCVNCAYHELNFRARGGLPITLNPDANAAIATVGVLLELKGLIVSGSKFPDLEWEQKHNVKLPRRTVN